MNVTLGGDRLGSGNKNKIALRNYERSTHNLSQKWTSSMTVGALYPFLVLPAMRGDKFEIDLAAAARTIPTQGPLFGSFKMQLDVFQCPVRLYQAILHNNPTNIGMKMNQVKFPKIKCYATAIKGKSYENMEFSDSCLMKYLGVSGLFRHISGNDDPDTKLVNREFNALPLLAYYDIFKNYYSNKQEELAYVIAPRDVTKVISPKQAYSGSEPNKITFDQRYDMNNQNFFIVGLQFDEEVTLKSVKENEFIVFEGNTADGNTTETYSPDQIYNQLDGVSGLAYISNGINSYEYDAANENEKSRYWFFRFYTYGSATFKEFIKNDLNQNWENSSYIYYALMSNDYTITTNNALSLNSFRLDNIDKMRMKLLSFNNVGATFKIDNEADDGSEVWGYDSGDGSGLPYDINGKVYEGVQWNDYPLNGLVVKTYQSDIYNNWIQTEWIDGENGIAAITAIDTSDGSFSIDTLNLSEKLYNMLNRIAVSGGTYEDWQDAVYMENPKRHMESPVYLGGMSTEVVFEEIIQSAPTEGSPLGTLGGRGVLVKRKGGHINVKVDEASFIIGIVSLTPRLNYTQGNEWYMTELDSMDDLHKPALDGIGFQNLMAEQLAWFGTYDSNNGGAGITRETVGKVPAWINYMTAVDKVYGDLAKGENSFMVLNRNYEHGEHGGISDVTTYIDPTKYNYAFAYKALDAQNFWVQIGCDIKARRLMSAKQIPNI